jgi:hypothetical protein
MPEWGGFCPADRLMSKTNCLLCTQLICLILAVKLYNKFEVNGKSMKKVTMFNEITLLCNYSAPLV